MKVKTVDSSGNLKKILLLMGIVFLSTLSHIWVRTQVLKESYRLNSIKKELKHKESELFSLELKKSRIMSPSKIEFWREFYSERGEDFQKPTNHQVHFIGVDP